jgi:hypothetical protein
MANCPVCEANVVADFGLVECESCGAQLLVHVDGRLEYQGAETKQVLGATGPEEVPPSLKKPGEEFEFGDAQRDIVLEDDDGGAAEAPIEFDPLAANDPTQVSASDFGQPAHDITENSQENPFLEQIEAEVNGASVDFSANANEEPPPMPTAVAFAAEVQAAADAGLDGDGNFDGGGDFGAGNEVGAEDSGGEENPAAPEPPLGEYNFDEPGGGAEPAPPVYNSAPADSPDLSDVARFGNSELSGSRDGALRYTLFIEGIDTTDVRQAFREAITDRKFVWDTDNILRSVRNGNCTIQNVAPSKAYMLISRLRGLPVKVRWEQYAISQT